MEKTGIIAPEILLPQNVDYRKWATIACDQFTSEAVYWNTLENYVGNDKSTLRLTFPEIYLGKNDDERIASINENMYSYLREGVFQKLKKGFILVVRRTAYREKRLGLMLAVDLEEYDYKKGSKSLIRATEATIEDRIPPRLKIRKDAPLEFPHIMLLYDDSTKSIIPDLYERRNTFEKVYDFDLNMEGGHLEGYFIDDVDAVINKFARLLDSSTLINKYGKDEKFLFAVGDGNHSLATAKKHWELIKDGLSEEEIKNHPARYALVEAVNVYDDGIYFEPIFRFVSGINKEKFISGFLNGSPTANVKIFDGEQIIENNTDKSMPDSLREIDEYIKEYITINGGKVDYVHGDFNLKNLVRNDESSVGIMFEKLEKKSLFTYVVNSGTFPKKTFSMGEGIEKRYYFEGRKIK